MAGRRGGTAAELSRSLSVSKQAAAKTITALERLDAALFTEVRERWAARISSTPWKHT